MTEHSATKRMAKNFTWLSIGDIVSRGVNFFAIIYVARVLGAAAFGLLNFAQAFQVYLVILVDSGLSILGMREIAKTRERVGGISLNMFIIRLLVALFVFVVSTLVLLLLPLSLGMRLLFIGSFLAVFYRALNADWVFMGLEKMEQIALSKMLFTILSFILIVIMVKTGTDLVRVPFIQSLCGVVVSLLFLLILFGHFAPVTLKHLAPEQWWEYFQDAIPLGASVILAQVYYNLDTIMLGFMGKPEVVGYYNAAYKIFYACAGFLIIWQATAFPVISHMIVKDKGRTEIFLRKYLRLTLLIVIPAMLLITYLSPLIIYVFYGNEYSQASVALQILIWGAVLMALYGIYGNLILIPLGRSKEFLYGVAGGAVANIVLNLILIPPFSFMGAAVATLLSQVMVTMLMFYLVRREAIQLNLIENMKIPVLAALIAYFLSLLFMQSGMGVRLIGSSLVFLMIYVVTIVLCGEKELLLGAYSEIIKK